MLAKLNILLMAMVKVLLGCSTVKKYKRKNFNLGSGHCRQNFARGMGGGGGVTQLLNRFQDWDFVPFPCCLTL